MQASTEWAYLGRLLLEDICSELARFLHSGGDPARFEGVRVDREYALDAPNAYADIRVAPQDAPPYFIEVKYGYDGPLLLARMRWKYADLRAGPAGSTRVVVVVDTDDYQDWASLEAELRAALSPQVVLDVWNEAKLSELLTQCFQEEMPALPVMDPVPLRSRIEQIRERLAFGEAASNYGEVALRQNLLWHFSTWRLGELRHNRPTVATDQLVPPGTFDQVVVLMADLSGFSRYVRDTPDEAVVHKALTEFYSNARYQVINAGGMLDQFVGDEVVALFGIPDRRQGYIEAAMRTALRLRDIGASVSDSWQRKIDLVQPSSGVHISMAMGRVQLVAMRALDHSRLAVIGDPLNICGRLLAMAGQGEIVVSNVLQDALQAMGYEFVERQPFDAHNLGSVRYWQTVLPPPLAAT